MNGRIIPDTPIVVDLWKRMSNPSSKYYFLSHMHSDHTQGLSASWRWPIYCSPVTAKLLVEKFQIEKHLVRPLELNTFHIIRLDQTGKETMTVTLFDANHCPGSVMFLYEGYFGRILYTGDFRYDPMTFPASYVGPEQPVDKLYLDNTFNNPRYQFPSRSQCKKTILEILNQHPDHEVVLGVYTLGKEDLMVDIALALHTRVVVSQTRMRMLQLLELRDVFTTDENEGCVRLVPQQAISKKNMIKWNDQAPTIAIIPTGLFSSLESQPYINQINVFIVPYSDHSSYIELQEFVSKVYPRAIFPIVRDSSFMNSNCSFADMHNFDDLLDKSQSTPYDIPPSVLQYMSINHSRLNVHDESQRDRKMILNYRKTHSNNHRINPTGVVFQDDDDDLDETQPTKSIKQNILKNDEQDKELCENESSRICEVPPQCNFRITSGVTEQGEHVSHLSFEDSSKPAKILRNVETATCLKRKRKTSESDTNKLHSSNEAGSMTGFSSKHLSYSDEIKPQTVSGKKTNYLMGLCKPKSDRMQKRKHSTCLATDSIVIKRISSKRARILPDSIVSTPTVETEQLSSWQGSTPKTLSSKTIRDYFQKLNVTTQVKEKSEMKSSSSTCDNALPTKKTESKSSPFGQVCVKPYTKQMSVSQRSTGLNKAFREFLSNSL